MKKSMLLLLVLVLTCIVNAHDLEQYRETCREINLPNSGNWSYQPTRPVPNWTFSCTPVSLLFSYYDYMIGSYNDCPLYAEPDPQYGGYFMTFHAKRTPTGQRRVYQCYVDENGVLEPQSEQPIVNNWEGYPTLAVDPVSGKPLYAWHANVDADAEYEVQFAYDRFLSGFTGIMSTPSIVFDNPSIVMPYNTTNNEFIWPSLQIGPSPVAGWRRAYVLARNGVTHTDNPCDNVKIAYADFHGPMLEANTTLVWSYTSIPMLDAWNHDTVNWRRPNMAFTVGNDGRIYYIGYHQAQVIATETPIDEPDLDVFVCSNYGEGTWERYTAYSKTPSWNPPSNYGSGPPIITNDDNIPYPDNQLFWTITNSRHINAVYDNRGFVHFAGLWNFRTLENIYYYSSWNVIKEVQFNVNTLEFAIREVYPKAGLSGDDLYWQPWDSDGNYLVDDYNPSTGYPQMLSDWNYPHWDTTAHYNAMTSYYNNFKITKPNANGWMACVWQNSWRAKQYHQQPSFGNPLYADVPEIFISVSANYGADWSDPIVINSVQIQQFSGIKPMWVYPADIIKNIGIVNGHPTGKLALMFYDDLSWGAFAISSPYGTNSGGTVKYMTIDIDMFSAFPPGITGYIRRTDNQQPICYATVTCGTQTAVTNADGYYIMNVSPGSYTVSALAPGFNSQSILNVVVTEGGYTYQNISLPESPLLTVSGNIYNSYPSIPLANATVTLSGLQTYSTSTGASGYFCFTNLLSNCNYSFIVSKPGFVTTTGIITTSESNYNMGIISLNEILSPPVNVIASVIENDLAVNLQWDAPSMGNTANTAEQKPMRQSSRYDRDLTGYRIWRFRTADIQNPDAWTYLGNSALNNSYIDTQWNVLIADTYQYAVKAEYSNTNLSATAYSNHLLKTSTEPDYSGITADFLYGASPNPFRNTTNIRFDLKDKQSVDIEVFNINGQMVRKINNISAKQGSNSIELKATGADGKHLPSGVYICRLNSKHNNLSCKLIILK